jgi:hypothetical protein
MNRTIARVRPHPGQIIPRVDRSGHCHVVMRAAVNANIAKTAVVSRTMIHRRCIKGPRTGAKKPSAPRKILTMAIFKENLTLSVKLLPAVNCFLTIILFKMAFNLPYFNYRYLSKNLYAPAPQYLAFEQLKAVFAKAVDPTESGELNRGDATGSFDQMCDGQRTNHSPSFS